MSRAFVKEDDTATAEVERPAVAPHRISPRGLALLTARRDTLAGQDGLEASNERARLDAVIGAAEVVPALTAVPEAACFGCTVGVVDDDGQSLSVTLVGEHEADPALWRLSCTSPLGRALVGAMVGDTVTWSRPSGRRDLEVVSLSLPEP
ncbi:GreA/GreB family elongation factor [Zavarzinia aquatilis]|uniref:Transcription elongation factor GreA/GreB C-terminal domain-containing protein n=1 Tax=Zavarzinia aquatilis TaxID=2211142 RepID=A0A317EHZ4_9PROT|nr:GreA/GreB family elongation factor [Zavarzinia aquatilis]PWR25053.1 hypothetical protein DKG74_04610 [Zavarzinia aquatilis]